MQWRRTMRLCLPGYLPDRRKIPPLGVEREGTRAQAAPTPTLGGTGQMEERSSRLKIRTQARTQAPDVASRDETLAATSLNGKGVEWILALT